MENSLPRKHRSWIWFIVVVCAQSGEVVNAQDQSGKDPVIVAVTVLDKKVYHRPIQPAVVASNRDRLSAKAFAKWESESRWRPLVSRVSYHVMLDWAKRNHVTPTREELENCFRNEAKQHLQAYATPEDAKRVELAIFMATGNAVDWVTAKALYEKYGGRIALSSFGGLISIEGRNALLKEYAAAGKIRFHDPVIEKEFWVGVENPAVLDVNVSDPKRISTLFATPPWVGWGVRTAKKFKENPELWKIPTGKQDAPVEK